jgi:digeranylgeranylglycerophospholipid reductase
VLVVGANVAGACTAAHLAERGVRVALVERQTGPEVGSRSCGDGLERFQFERLGLPVPEGEFILREVKKAYLVSPDRESRFLGAGAGIAIDRFGLNQHLLARAVGAGAELLDRTEALSPLVEGGIVTGARVERRDGDEVQVMRARVTVDAAGWRGVLRHRVPEGWRIAEELPVHETAIAYREERRRASPKEDLTVEATFDFDIAPRGLYWYADRTESLVNVGVGMQRGTGTPSPRRVIRERLMSIYPDLKATEVIRAGGGIIPNRRPIDCPVADGLVAVGDAACQVNPLSGSGIGASLYASRILADAVATALEGTGHPRTSDLFPYVTAYQRGYGKDQAAYQVLRQTLQSMTNRQMNRLMGSGTLSEEDMNTAVRTGRLDLSFGRKLKAAGKLLGEPGLVRTLVRMQRAMEAVRGHYSEFPVEVAGLDRWSREAARFFQ